MRRNDHAFAKVETMRLKPLHAGVEVQLGAAGGARVGHEPVKEKFAVSLRAFGDGRDEIIHVEDFSPGKKFPNAEAGDGFHAAVLDEGQLIAALTLLAAHALDELRLGQMRAQLRDDRETLENFGITPGGLNVGHDRRRMNERVAFAQVRPGDLGGRSDVV